MDRVKGDLSPFELEVLAVMLDGDHPVLASLREHVAVCRVLSREFTGVGFWTFLKVPLDTPRADIGPERIVLGGVYAEIEGVEHGAGFILFVEDGYLDNLEGFTYDDPWPKQLGAYTLSAMTASGDDTNLDKVKRAWRGQRTAD